MKYVLVCTGCLDEDGLELASFDTIEAAKAHESVGENAHYGHEYVIQEKK